MTVGTNIPERGDERVALFQWIGDEFRYADAKFADQRNDHDEEMRVTGVARGSFWERQILQYLDRVHLFGISTPQGRQALGKSCMTILGALESAQRVFGPLPAGGYPSGEIR